MHLFLHRNKLKKTSETIAIHVVKSLKERGATVVMEDQEAVFFEVHPLSQVDPKNLQFVITLGGDGTILRAFHHYPHIQAPILGINLGSLGFMADIPLNEIDSSLEELLNGHYTIQERIMLEGGFKKNTPCLAVNEICFHRSQNPTLIDLAIYVDDVYLNTFSADGIIIATPTGSTAYSLSAGGPIVTPELNAFILTPICPHTISNRPVVLMPKKDIRVEYLNNFEPIEVTCDGLIHFPMKTEEAFYIRKAESFFRLVNLTHHDYFSTLRTKLGWAGKLKI